MYLVKTLALEHRDAALENGSVRIGTINYYRDIEDKARKDADEGLGHIIWSGQELSSADHNKLFERTDRHRLADGWTIKNRGVPLHGSYPNFNVFTFCFSEVSHTDEIAKTSGSKGTRYYFITNLKEFVERIKRGLIPVAHAAIEKYAPDQADEIKKGLEVLPVTYRIRYSDDSKARVVNESNIDSIDPMALTTWDFFQKKTFFSYEREIRTCWFFFYNDKNAKKDVLSIPHPDERHVDLTLGSLPISRKRRPSRSKVKTSPARPDEYG